MILSILATALTSTDQGSGIAPCVICFQYIEGCSVHRGMFSTSEDTISTLEGYHEYIGDVQ